MDSLEAARIIGEELGAFARRGMLKAVEVNYTASAPNPVEIYVVRAPKWTAHIKGELDLVALVVRLQERGVIGR
jgi:hypothetical protein